MIMIAKILKIQYGKVNVMLIIGLCVDAIFFVHELKIVSVKNVFLALQFIMAHIHLSLSSYL